MERKDPPSGPRPISDAIRLFWKESGLRRSAGDERVLRAWTDAAGPAWKERATPCSFRAGQLTVEVASSVHLAELKGYHAETIRARANAALGEARIRKVTFKLTS